MRQKTVKNGIYSIRKILLFLAVILLIVVVAGISYIHNRQQSALVTQAAEAQQSSLASFLRRMDEGLAKAEDQMYSILYNHEDLMTLNHPADEISRYLAKESIADEISQIVQLSDFVECAWFYSPAGDEPEFLARNNYTGVSLSELLAIQETILDLLEDSSDNQFLQNDRWSLLSVGDQDYLFWVTPVSDSYCGLWVSTHYLFSMLLDLLPSDTDGQLLLCTSDGESLFQNGDLDPALLPAESPFALLGDDYINICGYSEHADIAAEIILPCRQILEDWHVEFDYTLACALLLLFVILAVFLFQSLIYRPLMKLLHQLDTLKLSSPIPGSGTDDLPSIRLDTDSRLKETAMISASINNLLDKIQLLHAQVYEAELNQRSIQCQYLQIRLKNHFYLNCLSIIHAMARLNHTDLIQELSMCLVKYLRFVQEDTDKLVRIEKELEHVKNYARIQELRFPGLFEYQEQVSAELYDAHIPPLMLQTFIENSVEHGMKRGQKNWIHIQAFYQEQASVPGIAFSIQDNGKGFSEEDLEGFAKDPETFDLSKSHGIGIRNIISRLKLLYNGKASIRFSNAPEGGAKIEIWIPFLDMEGDMEHV